MGPLLLKSFYVSRDFVLIPPGTMHARRGRNARLYAVVPRSRRGAIVYGSGPLSRIAQHQDARATVGIGKSL